MLHFFSEPPEFAMYPFAIRSAGFQLATANCVLSLFPFRERRGSRRYYYLGVTLGYIFSDSDCRQVQEEGSLHGKKQMPHSIYYVLKHIALVKNTTYSRCKRNGPVDFFSSDKFQWVFQQIRNQMLGMPASQSMMIAVSMFWRREPTKR